MRNNDKLIQLALDVVRGFWKESGRDEDAFNDRLVALNNLLAAEGLDTTANPKNYRPKTPTPKATKNISLMGLLYEAEKWVSCVEDNRLKDLLENPKDAIFETALFAIYGPDVFTWAEEMKVWHAKKSKT